MLNQLYSYFQKDKLMHFMLGFLIYCGAYVVLKNYIYSFIAVLIISVLREWYGDKWDWLDLVYTIVPSIIMTVIYK